MFWYKLTALSPHNYQVILNGRFYRLRIQISGFVIVVLWAGCIPPYERHIYICPCRAEFILICIYLHFFNFRLWEVAGGWISSSCFPCHMQFSTITSYEISYMCMIPNEMSHDILDEIPYQMIMGNFKWMSFWFCRTHSCGIFVSSWCKCSLVMSYISSYFLSLLSRGNPIYM